MDDQFHSFIGGDAGPSSIVSIEAVIGPSLKMVPRMVVRNANLQVLPDGTKWLLRGVTSNQRYITKQEQASLLAKQDGLGRLRATCAALIRITKTPAWWALTQEERRDILETRSTHIA